MGIFFAGRGFFEKNPLPSTRRISLWEIREEKALIEGRERVLYNEKGENLFGS